MPAHATAYTVRPGDSLWKIARHHYGHGALWPIIFVHNQRWDAQQPGGQHRLVDPDRLRPGQVIQVPDHVDAAHLRRAPGQRATPGPIHETEPAPSHGAAAPSVATSAPGRPARSGHAGGSGATLLNDFNVRFDTSRTLLKRKVGQFEVEIQFKGYVSLRRDALIQATSFTNKALENQRRIELGRSLGDLIATRKLKVEWTTGRIEYECLLTAHMASGKPAPVSTGFVLDRSVPPVAWRTKINIVDGAGHWRDIIYRAENLSITITVRWKPDARGPKPPSPPAVVALVPAAIPASALVQVPAQPAPQAAPIAPSPGPAPRAAPSAVNDPARTPDTGDYEGETWLGHAWHWVEHHPAEVAAAVVVAVVVVAAAPEIAAALASGALARGAAAALGGAALGRMATAPGA